MENAKSEVKESLLELLKQNDKSAFLIKYSHNVEADGFILEVLVKFDGLQFSPENNKLENDLFKILQRIDN
ncbi:hypothetical protein [Leptospira interrogans]|uniref:Uncharacterized protein n=1 Tax=Leptospira interrogans serovar Canicola TaxID=211880 RepID=A0AAP9WBW2_LEPIR|nr:hypothetical protein [Leptospira interrogans]QOI43021.1 hypothetical protein Lepto782_12645 [Leptospira interrogans serovar Canicola]